MTSVHLVRKAAIDDTAFNHEFHSLLDETKSEDSDDVVPETKDQYFEFTDGYHIMRIIKTILYIQLIGLILDNPTIQSPVLFHAFCAAICYYSLNFHSRIFLDIIWTVQKFFHELTAFLLSQNIPTAPTGIEIITRKLNVNP